MAEEDEEKVDETPEDDAEVSAESEQPVEGTVEPETEEDVEEEPADPVVRHEGKYYGTGRRKQSVARVWVTAGTGKFDIDGEDLESYFDGRATWTNEPLKPLECLDFEDKIDVEANLKGGGKTGQAEALKLGIARALVDMDANARPPLHTAGYMTRDDRDVERKKINQPGARAKSQVSKR